MGHLTDDEIRDLLARDAGAGWRAFVDRYTPTLLALIERAGIHDYDEAMDVYLRICERLSAGNGGRLLRHDPARGPWAAWLPTVVRNVVVDWVRSRAGRPRLFGAVKALPRLQQLVFELYYWEDRSPSEICEILSTRESRTVTHGDVLDALDAIHGVLSERHHRELLAMAVRSRVPASLEAELEYGAAEPVDDRANPERRVEARQFEVTFNAAVRSLSPEDAAILRLKYVQGLSLRDIQRALHLDRLTEERVRQIVASLRARLASSPAPWRLAGGVPE